MAEAFPSAILDSVLKQLESPIFQRNNKLNCDLGIQLRDLRSKLELIKDVIDEAELMGILFPKLVGVWVCELERILYEVDDLLDEAVIRSMPESGMFETVRLGLYSLPFQFWKFPRKMKNLNERLEGILKECYNCNLLVGERGDGNEKPVARKGILRYDPDYVNDGEFLMIGRDNDKKKVIEILLDEDNESPVIWITGPAGVGKRTLCRVVYNDEEVRNHFDFQLWVDIRGIEDFSCSQLLNKLSTKFHGGNDARSYREADEVSQLRDNLASIIGCSKIFLVLDGYPPNHDCVDLLEYKCRYTIMKFRKAMPAGSRILVPKIDSRSKYIGGHKLENNLSQGHSRLIFEKTARVSRHVTVEWVEDLGRQIVRRCEGNPALLKGVGTLLCGKVSEDSKSIWKYFAFEFDFRGQYDHYLKMMLPHYVFQKFHQFVGYLYLFSSNSFKFEALLTQFAANGFTNMSDELQRGFKATYLCKMDENEDWDALDTYGVSSMACPTIMRLAGTYSAVIRWEDDEFREWSLADLAQVARHVSIGRHPSSTDENKQIRLPYRLIEDVIHRRSLLFLGKWCPVKISVQTLDMLDSNLRYLRVLDLQDLALKELPSSISKLIHLRYLDVSRNDFKELPESICRLKNLQTLRLVYCDKLTRLPDRIKNIRNLKHLEIDMCLDLTHMPPRIAKLTCLQSLDRFVVCPHKGGLRYLEFLDNLKGHLAIEFPRHWENSGEDAGKANLERKKGLTFLEFKCRGTEIGDEDNDNVNVLEKLKPSTNIKKLSIVNFAGTTFPSWITPGGMGTCLTRISISRCKTCNTLPPFHGFPKLKYLTLTSIMNVEYLQDSNNGGDANFLPCLSELKIGNMIRLKGWSRNLYPLPIFRSMESVEIWKCPRLTVMPCFNMRKHLPNLDAVRPHVILQDVSEKMLQSLVLENHHDFKLVSIQDMVSLPINIVANLPHSLAVEDCNQWQLFLTNEAYRGTQQKGEPLFDSFKRLRCLSIANCRAMKHLSSSLSQLTHLRELRISRCSEELDFLYDEDHDGMPWKYLRSLDRLEIGGFQKLQAIPQGIRHLPALVSLRITDCRSLKRGVDSLSKVRILKIKSCPNFVEELKSEGMDTYETDEEGCQRFDLHPHYRPVDIMSEIFKLKHPHVDSKFDLLRYLD